MTEESVASRIGPSEGFRELTRALTKGSEEGWGLFFDQYARRLRGYLSACWRGEDECLDDLLQETLLRAVKHMRVFDDEGALWSWLTVLARSVVADRGRRETRWRRFMKLFREKRPMLPKRDENLRAAFAKMSSEERRLLEMKYEENLKVAEIAAKLETIEKAVESRLTRARCSLRKHYRP